MATDFKNLSVDYKALLKNTSISDRVSLTQTSAGQQLLSALTPTELANIFPDYYKRSNPDVSGFIEATARRYGRGKPQTPGAEYTEEAKPGTRTGAGGLGGAREGGRTGTVSDRKDAIIQRLEETGLKMPPDVGAKDITERGSALLKLIQSKESMPRAGYSTYDVTYGNYGGPSSSKYVTPESMFNGRKLSDLNIEEVMTYQRALRSQTRAEGIGGGLGTSAVGRGQFLEGTLKQALSYAGVSPKDYANLKFTPELQDKLMLLTAIHKRGLDPDKIEQWIDDPKAIQKLGLEWEGLSVEKGKISLSQLQRELKNIAALPSNKRLYEEADIADMQKKGSQLKDGLPQPLVDYYNKLPEYRKTDFAYKLNKHIEDNFNNDVNKFNETFNKNAASAVSELPTDSEFRDRVVESQKQVAGIRKGQITTDLKDQLNYAAHKTGLGVEVVSGGQRMEGAPGHTGSHRHDEGRSADLKLFITDKNGQKIYLSMTNPEDQIKMKAFVKNAVAAGATGVGAALDYMGDKTIHIGGGTPAVWGKDRGPAQWISEAHAEGLSENKKNAEAGINPLQAYKEQREQAIKEAKIKKQEVGKTSIEPPQQSDIQAPLEQGLQVKKQESPKPVTYNVNRTEMRKVASRYAAESDFGRVASGAIDSGIISDKTIMENLEKRIPGVKASYDEAGNVTKITVEDSKFAEKFDKENPGVISAAQEHEDGGTVPTDSLAVPNTQSGQEDTALVNKEGQVTDTVSSSERLIPGPVETRVEPERLRGSSENLKQERNADIDQIREELNALKEMRQTQDNLTQQAYSAEPTISQIEQMVPTDAVLNSSLGRYTERIYFAEQGRHFSGKSANFHSNG